MGSEPTPIDRSSGALREIVLSIVETGGARAVSLGLSLVALAATARWLGPEGRGTVAMITTWAGLFAMCGALSLGQVAIHRATQTTGTGWLGPTLGALTTVTGAVSVLALFAFLVAYVGWADGLLRAAPMVVWLLGIAMIPLLLAEEYSRSLLLALDRVRVYNRVLVIGRSVGVVLLLLAVGAAGWGVPGALLGTLAGQLLVAGGGVRFLWTRCTGQWAGARTRAELGALLRGGMKLHLNTVGTLLFTSADIVMIHAYMGAAATGIYQLAFQLILVMLVLPQAAAMVMFGRIAELGPDAAWGHHRRVLAGVLAIMGVTVLVAGLAAPQLISAVAGNGFEASIPVFRWLLVVLLGMTLSTVMAPQWIGRGYFWQASAITLTVGLGNVAANAILIPRLGLMGAVWASVGTYALAVLGNGVMVVYCEWRARQAAAPHGGPSEGQR